RERATSPARSSTGTAARTEGASHRSRQRLRLRGSPPQPAPPLPGGIPAKSIAAAVFRRGGGAVSCLPGVANDSFGTCEVPYDSFAALGSTATFGVQRSCGQEGRAGRRV